MIRRHSMRVAGAALLLVTLLAVSGCETDDRLEALSFVERLSAGDGAVLEADLFHPEVSLYRRYTGSKWRLDKDHVFTIKDESHVKAEVTFGNMRSDRTYSLHLVWIKPDGKEMYRRYAEVTRHSVRLPDGVLPDSTGTLPEYFTSTIEKRFGDEKSSDIVQRLADDPDATVTVNEVVYKKAVDLGYAKRNLKVDAKPRFRLSSRLNISREKERELGAYTLRIYLDRRLLHETPFTLQENT